MTRRCTLPALLSAGWLFVATSGGVLAASTWKIGDALPVQCLNRTVETGEHVTDPNGNLQYIPFYTCSETSAPLALNYGLSTSQNCTIDLTDPIYHLFEFYIHNDAPLTCRIPTNAPSTAANGLAGAHISGSAKGASGLGMEEEGYTPLVMALSGTLQLSHLHVANELNLVVHTAADEDGHKAVKGCGGNIDSASAYSTSPSQKNTKLIIGDTLTLTFHTRWYTGSYLPLTNELQKHGFWSTLSYCIFAAGASAAVCIAYFRGVDLPRRLRFHGVDRLGSARGGNSKGLPTYNGYGYTGQAANGVVANGGANGYSAYGGYGMTGTGKRD